MRIAVTILTTWALAAGPLYGDATAQPPPTPAEEQPEVLTRGPVHEAFAEPVNLQVQAGLVVLDKPPAKIEEIPPTERPEGDQFVWVPGYWSWDAERNGYIWVSACWRAAPPNMYWVPGYWAQVPEGWEWVAGFWAPVSAQRIEYLPAPPALDDLQPPGLPPSADTIWVPSCQYWSQDRYVQRPGYWLREQPGWVWVPSHYTWTPRGYVFAEGHWDYSLDRRGVLFAPVYLPRSVYTQAGFSYSPSIVIDTGMLELSLFAYPRYSHYYFGDYYDDAYLRLGIYPRFESERSHTWYDPIYEYDRWRNRRADPRWEENQRHQYDLRRSDQTLRPPRTYREMETRQAKLPEPQRRDVQMARPLSTVVADKATPLKFGQLNSGDRKKITTQATDLHKFRDQRTRWESTAPEQKTAQPPTERKGLVTPPIERKESGPTPVEGRSSASPPVERMPPFVPPRAVWATKPETVTIPTPPITGKPANSGAREVGPPSKPAEERQSTRDGRNQDTNRNKERDKNK
jgi:hypothetical protein